MTGSAISSLTRAGFEVSTSTDYPEVLMRLDELTPDLIVLTDGLSMDSFAACSWLY
ncbi:hypothetical protein ACFLTL_02320 [Chloroflexota bacterium]